MPVLHGFPAAVEAAPDRIRLQLAALVVVLAAGFLSPASGGDVPPPGSVEGRATTRVLFVGSSYTYYHNLPRLLSALAGADPGAGAIETRMIVEGGACLRDHLEGGEALRAVRDWQPDFVVLQAQSTFCRTFLVNGAFRVGGAGIYERSARRLAEAILEAGSTPVLVAHWKRRGAPEWDQWAIDAAVERVAAGTGAKVLPVGDAFQVVRRADPTLPLYATDGSHPAPAGSLLAAETLFALLTDRSTPVVGRIRGAAVDEREGRVLQDSLVTLVEVDSAAARLLAGIATRIASEAGSRPEPPAVVPAPVLPAVPAGRPAATGELVGSWQGPLDVYPYAAMLRMSVDSTDSGWELDVTVDFGGRPDALRPDLTEVRRTPTGLSFVDPDGPDGGIVRYRGAFTGEAIEGIAEIVVPGGDVYAVGEWKVETRSP